MSYDVSWTSRARSELAAIQAAMRDKESVEHAALRVDLELAGNPLEAGESRDAGRRVLFKYPLVVWFRVNERLREAIVYDVRQWLR